LSKLSHFSVRVAILHKNVRKEEDDGETTNEEDQKDHASKKKPQRSLKVICLHRERDILSAFFEP
jgi:hypothetical protein